MRPSPSIFSPGWKASGNSMKCTAVFIVLTLWVLIFPFPVLPQDDYKFDLAEIEKEIEKKPYSLGGFLEFEPVLFGLDRDAALYKLRFFDQDEGKTIEKYDGTLRLEGGYQKGIAQLYARAEGRLRYDYLGWDEEITLQEGYLSLKPRLGLSFDAGKKVARWGTGYAFNPAGFVQRPKDPEDPEEALQGFYMLTADWINSFQGPLKTLTFTPVILPVTDEINDDFGEPDHINFAAKLYMLLWDTDVDLLFFTGDSRTTRYGFDFAKNIKSNLEVHGEMAWITDFQKKSLDEKGNLSVEESDVLSALLGIRYLTGSQITFIMEYFHDATGVDEEDLENFFRLVNRTHETFLETGDPSPLIRAEQISRGTFVRPNPGRDYLYFRASQKEPFDILYFIPAVTSIINLQDQSFSVIPELLYSPRPNVELRLRGALLAGGSNTDFGEKQNDWRAELRIRYFF